MLVDVLTQNAFIFFAQRINRYHFVIHFFLEIAFFIPDVGHAARHAGGKVAARFAEDDRQAARHVLAAVVACTFDDDLRS